jgi:hypothetical protein
MKKSKLSVGLVASFIGALALTSCGDTSRLKEPTADGELVSFVGYNGSEKIVIGANDMYGKYSESKDGTQLYYNAILEALVRYEYKNLAATAGSTLKSYELLYSKAQDSVEKAKETATDNAKNNDTKYDDEWESILESHDCETEEDLLQYYLYDLEKTELVDNYFKANETSLMNQFLGLTNQWKPVTDKVANVNSVFPYHVLHTLVKFDDASYSKDEYNKSTISKAEAIKLWNVVRNLIDGNNSFQDVAGDSDLNDDSSASKYGDVGIITPKTSFVNEFKLGLYAYDALLSGINAEGEDTADIYKAFGLDADAKVETERTVAGGITKEPVQTVIGKEMKTNVKTPLKATYGAFTTVPTIPYDVFRKIGELADQEKIDNEAPESGDVALPRNILFNQFLNFHSPFVITDDDLVVDTNEWGDDAITVAAHDFEDNNSDLVIKNNNFKDGIIAGKKVLCDRDGNVIIGVLSEYGIHFMIMRKSVFKGTNESVATSATTTKADTSLQEYYTTLIPGETGYPTGKETYVNMVASSDPTSYKERADEIVADVKDTSVFDVAYEYRLYEFLYKQVEGKIVFAEGKEYIKSNIESYIGLLRETRANSDADSINEAWETYLLALKEQNFQRGLDNTRVSATCAFTFNHANAAEYKKAENNVGGHCYVK